MFEKVLAALDFSNTTQSILSRMGEVPGIKEVVLFHVVDATRPSRHGWTHNPEIENAKIILAEKKEELENLGLKVHIEVESIVSVITEGDVAQAICEMAQAHHVSLIMIGARGINPIKDLLLGSVSTSVLRNATTNVLIISGREATDRTVQSPCPPPPPLFSRILLPTDFSNPARETVSLVSAIPGEHEAVLLHVINRADSPEELEKLVEENKARLEETAKNLTQAGFPVTLHIRIGDPDSMILAVADDDAVSIIIMNAFGTGWLREMLLGSTTLSVVRRAKRPVLVIRAEHHKD